MKKLLLLTLLVGVSQGAPPDCIATYRFTNRTTDAPDAVNVIALVAGTAAAPAINNKVQGCVGWEMMTSVEGLASISIQLEDSANTYTAAGGSPTQWFAFQGTAVSGSNPSTATTTSIYIGTGFYPWIRARVASSTGTGSVDVLLFGWKSTTMVTSSGGVTSFSGLTGTIGLNQLDPLIAVFAAQGAGPPGSTTCTPGGGAAGPVGNFFIDVTNKDLWYCSDVNTWRKSINTSDSGPLVITGQAGGTPTTPATGFGSLFYDSTLKLWGNVDDVGALTMMPSNAALTNAKIRACATFTFDGQGSAITNNTVSPTGEVLTALTVAGYNVYVDTGTITIDVLKATNSNGTPSFVTITSSQTPAIASGTNKRSTTVNLWTSPSINDLLQAKVTAVSAATKASLVVECTQ